MKKNVLFITADQWRGDCLGCGGHPVVKTPNIDRLAEQGTYFSRHYCQAAPCSPARAALYTGLYQMNTRVVANGTPLDGRHDNIAKAARRAGYNPTLFGYTDQGADPRTTDPDDPWLRTFEGILPGFTVRVRMPTEAGPWLSWLKARGYDIPGNYEDIYRPAEGPADPPRQAPPVYSADETETAFLTDTFIDWIDEHPQTETPWFAHLSLLRPHPPFIVPTPYADMYDPADGAPFKRAADIDAECALHPVLDQWISKIPRDPHFRIGAEERLVRDWSDDDFRTIRAIYWGMISEVDNQIGRIEAALRERGLWDNTVIVFTSDHGEMMGDHHTLGKFGFFDQSYHIPLIIRDPGRARHHGGTIREFTESIDIMPTVLDVLGEPVPSHLDGMSLLPFLDGADSPAGWRQEVHWEYDFRHMDGGNARRELGLALDECNLAVIRGERYKYVHFGGLPALLFDLQDDPAETVNRIDDDAFRDVRLAMAEKLLAWRARHLDRSLSGILLTSEGAVSKR